MKSQIVLWWVLTAFFFACTVTYTVWNLIADGYVEWTGSVALLFTSFMAGLIAFFIRRNHQAQQGVELPEDTLTAEIDDADPEFGEFSPWSWWPLVLASAVAIAVIALATAHFLIPVAAGLLVVGLFGWVYEYYRGNFAR
ncbi:cytochrome c oxidase subunit 4 [Microbacterium sp.]|uniref:aa3-type cytochrome oxidase subunit IV n=1 Tax=Microbacterium sp. TaxID=51671 RepID=UPI0039E32127